MAEQYQIVLTAKAEKNVQDILRYARSVESLMSAKKIYDLLEDSFAQIARMPTRRPVYHATKDKEVRSYEADKRYRILYHIEEEIDLVSVIRVGSVKMSKAIIVSLLEEA